ncbi:hypothetical protein CDL12_23428 [Handroanthus impetiginosus]|uniref:C2H2-type domain-containing protein n=1 Tax=Handroanthus impetiginosus TaxID=429701 RepID=A0A2G9GFH5_9LAMI|nr:hypothetical protein CDL12_23428 [Handroanthus impetiginosus]
MESNNQEESIDSCEEADQVDLPKDNLGVGRSYECGFCKRGFNTAQALGGHMNIHRRDRARNKDTKKNSNEQEENRFGPGKSVDHHFGHHDHQSSSSYAADFPASTSGSRESRPLYGSHFRGDLQYCSSDFDRDERQHQNQLVPDDGSMNFRSDYHRMVLDDLEKKRQGDVSQKEELDLELRLGYDS